MFHGYDVRTWMQEGLLDAVVGVAEPELVAAVQETACRFYWGTGARQPESYVKRTLEAFQHHADGTAVWDVDGPAELPEHWEIIRNMGHRQRVEAFAGQLPKMKTVKMLSVDGYDFGHTYGKGAPDNWPPEMILFHTNG